jgi:hypothetical protein
LNEMLLLCTIWEDIVLDAASVTVVPNNVYDNLIIIPLRYIEDVFSLPSLVNMLISSVPLHLR